MIKKNLILELIFEIGLRLCWYNQNVLIKVNFQSNGWHKNEISQRRH